MLIHSRKTSKYIPPEGHTKYINEDGDYVPSVTTIIKVIPKDALIYWANSLGWKKKSVRKELEISANVGTNAHNYVEKIILVDKSNPDKSLSEYDLNLIEKEIYETKVGEERNAIISFLDWYRINRFDIDLVAIEKTMSGYLYGGTCDLICRYKGKLMIFDFKTSGDFYFSMFVQMAAYVRLYENETGEEIEDIAVLRLDKKNGDIAKLKRLSEVKNGDIDYYYYVFEQCLNLHRSLYILENDWK